MLIGAKTCDPRVPIRMQLLSRTTIALALLFLVAPICAAENGPCSVTSSVSDVQLTLAVKGNRTVFQEGEIIPLVMSFTSTAKKSYWADTRNYDRSGRLGIESYCMEPEASDPLASYFKFGTFISGGLGSEQELNATPFTLRAELNEWRKPSPGRYRPYVVSYRI